MTSEELKKFIDKTYAELSHFGYEISHEVFGGMIIDAWSEIERDRCLK